MRNNRNWFVLLALPLLLATQVWAQGAGTGTVNGRVAEAEGLPLPGVTVTAKSPALQGSRTAVTNVNGDFVMPNLSPGDYTLTFVMSGFTTVTRTAKVSGGQQVAVNAKMSISAVAAEATVVAQSETVSQTAQAASTYSAEVTSKLPVTRNYLSTVALSAGVNFNFSATAPSISGSASFDNVMTVNGVNLQDPVRGTQTNLFIEDSIQETTTMTSGVSAEYGRFTGGVINAITKQGGNSFSGSLRVTLNNNDWREQPPIPATLTDKTVPTYEATLGGPIWKDRIWFFAAGRAVDNETPRSTVAPAAGGYTEFTEDRRYEGKLTISPFQNHTVTGTYTEQTSSQSNYAFTGLPILDDPQIRYSRELPSDVLAINYNGVITSNFFVEAQYSKKTFQFLNSGGTNQDLIAGTPILSAAQGYAQFWAPYFCASCPGGGEARDNDDILAKGTVFLSTKSLGSHSVAFGYQNFGIQREGNNWQSPTNYVLYSTSVRNEGGTLYPVIDEGSSLYFAPIFQESQGADIRTWSIFVNDTWRLNNNFSFNLGVRYDKNDATDQAGAKVADDSAFSPRLSATYDVKGDGKMRLSASYSKYVGQIQETQAGAASSAGSPASYYYYWYGKSYNQPGQALTPTATVLREMFDVWGITGINMFPPNTDPDFVSVPGVNVQIRGGLSSPYANEYVLGIGGTVGQNFVYRVDGVRREFKNFYSQRQDTTTGKVTDSLGNVYDLAIVENSDTPEREYTGLHTALSYRWNALSLSGNWTWSHLIGNTNGENTGGGSTRSGFESYPEYLDLKWNAPRGSLASDQRHRIRVTAAYDFNLGPVSITPGLIQAFDSGTPYGAIGTGQQGAPVSPFVTNPGYETPPARNTYYYTARDAYKTDDIWRTDLSLNFSGKIGPVEIFVQPQVWNLFNAQGVVAVNTAVSTGQGTTPNSLGLVRFNPFTDTPIECPQTGTAADCRALGANYKKGVNFGKPTATNSYQIPRQFYVTMGIRF